MNRNTKFSQKLKNIFLALQLTLITLVSQQCIQDESPKDYPVNKINFSITKEIHLPLDSFTQPLLNYYQILPEDTLKFIILNKFNKSIYIYDFKGSKLLKKTPLIFESGEPLNLDAFYYLNKDSILLFPEYGDFYLICNEDGLVSPEKRGFVDEDDKDKIESHWITSSNPIIEIDNKIYINNVFGWIAKEDDLDKFLLIEHNMDSGESKFFIKHPPSIYDKNFDNSTFRHMYFTLKESTQTILYSFAFDPYIYEYSGNMNIDSVFCSPEDYKLPGGLKKGTSSEEAWLHFQTNFSFSNLEFDPFRNVLLRMALQPYNIDDIKAGIINPENPKKPKIYVFDADKNYRLLGEIMLDEESNYYFINMFATEEGLWIQKIVDNEDIMCFELITYEL